MEMFQYQTLRNVVKEDREHIVNNFGDKYRELRVEGSRIKVIETMYVGTDNKVRRRFHNYQEYGNSQGWAEFPDRRRTHSCS